MGAKRESARKIAGMVLDNIDDVFPDTDQLSVKIRETLRLRKTEEVIICFSPFGEVGVKTGTRRILTC